MFCFSNLNSEVKHHKRIDIMHFLRLELTISSKEGHKWKELSLTILLRPHLSKYRRSSKRSKSSKLSDMDDNDNPAVFSFQQLLAPLLQQYLEVIHSINCSKLCSQPVSPSKSFTIILMSG